MSTHAECGKNAANTHATYSRNPQTATHTAYSEKPACYSAAKTYHFTISLPHNAQEALCALEHAGYEAWVVGGAVRDAVRGIQPDDFDIACSAHWTETKRVFEATGWRVRETGAKHGTVTVIKDCDAFEITTYRRDGNYLDARRPEHVTFVGSIEEDLARRDFTMNALAYHPARGILDMHGGVADIEQGIIRAIGNPQTRFEEDALRILRACRFSSQTGFSIDATTLAAAERCTPLLAHISSERITQELQKFVCGEHVRGALMQCCDVLAFCIPELAAMKGLDQRTPYHVYDVLEHTAVAMECTQPEPLLRWAALLHDMGKPRTFFTDEKGVGHFYGHAAVSVELARPVLEGLTLSPGFIEDLLVLIRHHDDVIEASPKAVKRMLRKLDGRPEMFAALCELMRADSLAHAPEFRTRAAHTTKLMEVLEEVLAAEEAFSLKHLAVNGHDLMEAGMQAGPRMGEVLDALLSAVIEEDVENTHEALMRYAAQKELVPLTGIEPATFCSGGRRSIH